LANSFPDKPDRNAKRYPLDLMQCVKCGHVQLGYVPDKIELYGAYKYETPRAQLPSLRVRAKALRKKYPETSSSFEIGANNGLFVHAMHDEGFFAGGMDPTKQDPFVFQDFFNSESASRVRDKNGKFGLILANNVFAHIDDLDEVIEGVDILLDEDGALIFEVQYLVDLLDKGMFDMIYHEHHDYHHLSPLRDFFHRKGFVLSDWEHIPNHGGSIRVTVTRSGEPKDLPEEILDFDSFADRVEEARNKVDLIGEVVVQLDYEIVLFRPSGTAENGFTDSVSSAHRAVVQESAHQASNSYWVPCHRSPCHQAGLSPAARSVAGRQCRLEAVCSVTVDHRPGQIDSYRNSTGQHPPSLARRASVIR